MKNYSEHHLHVYGVIGVKLSVVEPLPFGRGSGCWVRLRLQLQLSVLQFVRIMAKCLLRILTFSLFTRQLKQIYILNS